MLGLDPLPLFADANYSARGRDRDGEIGMARAVNLGSLWAAFDKDVNAGVKRLKITRRAFNARKLQGLRIITQELIRRRVAVR